MSVPPQDWAEYEDVPVLADRPSLGHLIPRFPLFVLSRHRTAARQALAMLAHVKEERVGSPPTVGLPAKTGHARPSLVRRVPRRFIGHGVVLALVFGAIFADGGLSELTLQTDWTGGAAVATDNVSTVDPQLDKAAVAAPVVLPHGPIASPASRAANERNDSRAPAMLAAQSTIMSPYAGTHTVLAGETLGAIAAHDNVSVATLVAANRLDPSMLGIGQALRIPQIAGLPHIVVENETVEQIAELYNVSPSRIREFPPNKLGSGRALVVGEEVFIPDAVAIGNGPFEGDLTAVTANPVGSVLDHETRLRAGPATAYDKLALLGADTPVVLVGQYGDWYNVRTKDGLEGWIARELLQVADGLGQLVPVASAVPPLPSPEPVVAAQPAAPAPAPAPAPVLVVNRWVWPTRGDLTSGYGYRNMKVGRFHNGYDVANSKWTPIRAANTGRVIEAGWCSGYGYCVKIDHGGGLISEYGHMAAKPNVRAGERVAAGERIGSMGMTYDRKGGGYASGVHLHFTLKLNGNAVNPGRYLP